MSETTKDQEVVDSLASSEVQSGEVNASQPLDTDDSIPEKFVGKSPLDIIKSYNEIERSFHKVSTERAEERKSREALESRIRDLESRPQTVAQPAPQVQEQDPFASYDEQFDKDPKEAIKSLVSQARSQSQRDAQNARVAMEQQLAAEYYNTQKRDNPEYVKLEPTMLELAKEFGDLVSPHMANSRKALKLLHLAALGSKREEFVSEAVSRAKKETTTIRDEKRNAFSESTSSKGESRKDFGSLSLEEMEKLLGRA